MIINDINNSKYFIAMDETVLCELLHPHNESEVIGMNFSMAHAVMEPGKSSLPHKITDSVEIYYILEGEGCMHINHDKEIVKTGQSVYIPNGACQWIKNIGLSPLKFLCIVSPPWKEENESICD